MFYVYELIDLVEFVFLTLFRLCDIFSLKRKNVKDGN